MKAESLVEIIGNLLCLAEDLANSEGILDDTVETLFEDARSTVAEAQARLVQNAADNEPGCFTCGGPGPFDEHGVCLAVCTAVEGV